MTQKFQSITKAKQNLSCLVLDIYQTLNQHQVARPRQKEKAANIKEPLGVKFAKRTDQVSSSCDP